MGTIREVAVDLAKGYVARSIPVFLFFGMAG